MSFSMVANPDPSLGLPQIAGRNFLMVFFPVRKCGGIFFFVKITYFGHLDLQDLLHNSPPLIQKSTEVKPPPFASEFSEKKCR